VHASSCEREPRAGAARKVLIAEDDEMLARFLERLLSAEGYAVEHVNDGASVLSQLRPELDLLLLDLNLPGLDGLSVLRALRQQSGRLPVLVLTARDRTEGLLAALDGGADDCLTKPFSYLELLARMRALLRRSAPAPENLTCCADLALYREQALVTRAGRRLDLTPREYKLLEYLMRTPEVPVARSVLLKEVWGAPAGEPSTNVVDVYMKYLRDKVDLPGLQKVVRTVRGTGYMISAA
jgi:DNA-binding response OmpR family regulator